MDYSKPGPIEKAFQNIIIKAMIRVFYVEFMLRGAIMNAMFNPCFVSNNKFFDDYMFDFVKKQLESKHFFTQSTAKEEFYRTMIRTAELDANNLNMSDAALKSLLLQAKNKFLKDSLDLYQTERQDYVTLYTESLPERDVMPYKLEYLSELPGVVQNPPVDYANQNMDIWTQNIPENYRINGGFFLEYYIRMRKKNAGNPALTDFSVSPGDLIRQSLRNRISRVENPILLGDSFDEENVLASEVHDSLARIAFGTYRSLRIPNL